MFKNVASQVITAQLVSSTDGSAVTSGTTTVYVTGDGGTQASGGGTVTHEGQGCWSYEPTQAETNYDHVAFTFSNSSAISAMVQTYTSVDANRFSGTAETDIDAILTDTGTTLPATLATIDTVVDSILADTGTDIPATLAALDALIDAIKAKTDNSVQVGTAYDYTNNTSSATENVTIS